MQERERAIGVFDSGLGGLTTVEELQKILPNEDIVYFGDTSRVPYGTRSAETIMEYAKQDINFLVSKQVKMIIVACGTASTILRGKEVTTIPTIGVIDGSVERAIEKTHNKKIGIIGTRATIDGGVYQQELEKLDSDVEVSTVACTLFVPLVESSFDAEDEITLKVIERYLQPLKEKGIDSLIMGCTHYPILTRGIKRVMGENVALINAGQESARKAKIYLESNRLNSEKKERGKCEYYVSDTVEHFEQNARCIMQNGIEGKVERIKIEEY